MKKIKIKQRSLHRMGTMSLIDAIRLKNDLPTVNKRRISRHTKYQMSRISRRHRDTWIKPTGT